MDWVKHDLLKGVALSEILCVFSIFLVQFGQLLMQEIFIATYLLKDSKFRQNLSSVSRTLITNVNGFLTIIFTCTRGDPKNNRNLNVARELEVVARCTARCRESTQYSSSLPRGVSLGWVLLLFWLFSKCLLGRFGYFMMADIKEQRVYVKFCFLFRTVPNRKQNFTHTLCSLLSTIIKIAIPPSRHL
jgi:hypothetical protein